MALRPVEDALSLRATDEVESRLAERGNALVFGQLARSLPHEINNPVSGILGMLELLLEDADPSSSDHELLGYAVQSCLQIRQLVDALSEVLHEDVQEDQELRLDDVARNAVELVRLTTAAKDVEIVARFGAGPWIVHGDYRRLKQVFVALLVNAQDALPQAGTVTLELGQENSWIVGSVTDTGPGIDAMLADEVFEPFVSTRARKGRAGLGLSFARAVARAHGGELRVRPDRGPGACLELVLPSAR